MWQVQVARMVCVSMPFTSFTVLLHRFSKIYTSIHVQGLYLTGFSDSKPLLCNQMQCLPLKSYEFVNTLVSQFKARAVNKDHTVSDPEAEQEGLKENLVGFCNLFFKRE